ncbi:MAG: cation transporter, partial [Terriglobales bacterium]
METDRKPHTADNHDHAGHAHGHASVRDQSRSALLSVLALTGSFMIIEVIVGFYSHSLALLADAGHMLSDVGALILALVAF